MQSPDILNRAQGTDLQVLFLPASPPTALPKQRGAGASFVATSQVNFKQKFSCSRCSSCSIPCSAFWAMPKTQGFLHMGITLTLLLISNVYNTYTYHFFRSLIRSSQCRQIKTIRYSYFEFGFSFFIHIAQRVCNLNYLQAVVQGTQTDTTESISLFVSRSLTRVIIHVGTDRIVFRSECKECKVLTGF